MTRSDALHSGTQTRPIMATIEWFKCFFGAVYEGEPPFCSAPPMPSPGSGDALLRPRPLRAGRARFPWHPALQCSSWMPWDVRRGCPHAGSTSDPQYGCGVSHLAYLTVSVDREHLGPFARVDGSPVLPGRA